MLNTTQHGVAPATEYKIRVKGGDLTPKGKGSLTIGVMSDGKVALNAALPGASGVPVPFDLTSLERLEEVSTRSGAYQGKQWIGPAVATAVAFGGVPFLVEPLISVGAGLTAGDVAAYTALVGSPYVAGVYTGAKLNRIVRFVAVTSDGRHCVAEMPEAAFRFVQGIKAAENLHIETTAAPVTAPAGPEAAPVPA